MIGHNIFDVGFNRLLTRENALISGESDLGLPSLMKSKFLESSPAIVDGVLANVKIETAKSRFNTLFTRFVAIGALDDGLTENPGTGLITRYLMTSDCNSLSSGSTASVYSALFSSTAAPVLWDNSHEFFVNAKVFGNSGSANDAFIGVHGAPSSAIPADATSVVRHIGFFFWDGALYVSNANGTTQTKTLITGYTVTNYNTYRYVFNAAKDILFYINDVLVATHTTNLPSGTSETPALLLGVETQSASSHSVSFSNNYSVFVSI